MHTRLNFDLETAGGIDRFRAFLQEAADLVVKCGGSLSGEHGDGQARGELLPRMFDDEIMQAAQLLAQNPKTVAEPSGAVATAAWLFHAELLPASNHTVAVISGGNIDPDLLARIRA